MRKENVKQYGHYYMYFSGEKIPSKITIVSEPSDEGIVVYTIGHLPRKPIADHICRVHSLPFVGNCNVKDVIEKLPKTVQRQMDQIDFEIEEKKRLVEQIHQKHGVSIPIDEWSMLDLPEFKCKFWKYLKNDDE